MNPILPAIAGPGYVAPLSTNGELNDTAIYRMLQALVVGITGLDPKLVRPRWQPEPPNQPDFEENWAAIGEINRTRDTFAAVTHDGASAKDTVLRNQVIEILASFYGPDANAYSELFVEGVQLAQNREQLRNNGFGFMSAGDSTIVPALLKERWVMGVDTPFRIRREQVYTYSVPNVTEVDSFLKTDMGVTIKLVTK